MPRRSNAPSILAVALLAGGLGCPPALGRLPGCRRRSLAGRLVGDGTTRRSCRGRRVRGPGLPAGPGRGQPRRSAHQRPRGRPRRAAGLRALRPRLRPRHPAHHLVGEQERAAGGLRCCRRRGPGRPRPPGGRAQPLDRGRATRRASPTASCCRCAAASTSTRPTSSHPCSPRCWPCSTRAAAPTWPPSPPPSPWRPRPAPSGATRAATA